MRRRLCACAVTCWLLLLTSTHVFRDSLAEIISYSAKENVLGGSDLEDVTEKKLEFNSMNRTAHILKYQDLSKWAHPHFDYGEKHVVLTARWSAPEDAPYVWDSPGDEQYTFAQLHFHWGSTDLEGSEHTINSERFPLELHLVHYLQSLGSLEAALHYEGGVRVVAVFYRLSEEDNPALQGVVQALPRVQQAGSSTVLHPVPLATMLHTFSRHYLSYTGSLTTPPCLEVVRWVLSTDAQPVSPGQMAAFRSLLDHKGLPIFENFRPLQPLNHRQILHIR